MACRAPVRSLVGTGPDEISAVNGSVHFRYRFTQNPGDVVYEGWRDNDHIAAAPCIHAFLPALRHDIERSASGITGICLNLYAATMPMFRISTTPGRSARE